MQFQINKSDENKEKFREANRASRKAARIAKDAAYEDLCAKVDSREGIKMVYKLAKTRERRSKYISDMPFINSLEGQILTVESDIIQRWLTYFEGLLNTEDYLLPYLLPVSRNHHGRMGTTADMGDNVVPSLTVFGCSLTAVEVETGPLAGVVFSSFLLPASFSFPWYCSLYDLFAEAT